MIRTLGGSGRVLSEGQGEFSRRVRESSLRESGRVLSEGQGDFSQRVRESSLGGSGRVLHTRPGRQQSALPLTSTQENLLQHQGILLILQV